MATYPHTKSAYETLQTPYILDNFAIEIMTKEDTVSAGSGSIKGARRPPGPEISNALTTKILEDRLLIAVLKDPKKASLPIPLSIVTIYGLLGFPSWELVCGLPMTSKSAGLPLSQKRWLWPYKPASS